MTAYYEKQMIEIYKEKVKDIAYCITFDHGDKIDSTENDLGQKVPDADPILDCVEDYIRDFLEDDLIRLIISSDHYQSLSDAERGVFIPDSIVTDILSLDNDDHIDARDSIKSYFIEVQEEVINKILEDIKSEVEEQVSEIWYREKLGYADIS